MTGEPSPEDRMKWFLEYVRNLEENSVNAEKKEGVRYPCPCCGYPTLEERGGFEICELCDWEDDGQDDHNASELLAGPNGDQTLERARRNFRRHGHMYDDPAHKTYSPARRDARQAMMSAFDAMPGADEAKLKTLWRDVRKAEEILRSAP